MSVTDVCVCVCVMKMQKISERIEERLKDIEFF